jgi:hypothetical protein
VKERRDEDRGQRATLAPHDGIVILKQQRDVRFLQETMLRATG